VTLDNTPPPHMVGLLTYFGARFDPLGGNVLGPRKGFQAKEHTRIGTQVACGLPESPNRHQRGQPSRLSRPIVWGRRVHTCKLDRCNSAWSDGGSDGYLVAGGVVAVPMTWRDPGAHGAGRERCERRVALLYVKFTHS
jgi:hypothetical protein